MGKHPLWDGRPLQLGDMIELSPPQTPDRLLGRVPSPPGGASIAEVVGIGRVGSVGYVTAFTGSIKPEVIAATEADAARTGTRWITGVITETADPDLHNRDLDQPPDRPTKSDRADPAAFTGSNPDPVTVYVLIRAPHDGKPQAVDVYVDPDIARAARKQATTDGRSAWLLPRILNEERA